MSFGQVELRYPLRVEGVLSRVVLDHAKVSNSVTEQFARCSSEPSMVDEDSVGSDLAGRPFI